MKLFYELLRESTITQAILTVMLWATICALVLLGHVVPDIVGLAGMGTLGFWFGTKTQFQLSQLQKSG